jgi:hypothetical protein
VNKEGRRTEVGEVAGVESEGLWEDDVSRLPPLETEPSRALRVLVLLLLLVVFVEEPLPLEGVRRLVVLAAVWLTNEGAW